MDSTGIENALLRLAGMAEASDRLLDLEINPLRVFADGSVKALDARVRLAPSRSIEPGI